MYIDIYLYFQRPVIEGSDDEQQQEEQPETRIEVEIPRIKTDLGRAVHYVKLPNFLSVETRYVLTTNYFVKIYLNQNLCLCIHSLILKYVHGFFASICIVKLTCIEAL